MGRKGGGTLNRLGFVILSILRESKATGRLSSMTLKEIAIAEDLGWRENTISKKIREFEQSGYVGRGLKEGRAATYFITSAGLECLERERKG
jgi:DNA-binding MarR family transcriptional regulator